MQYSEQIEHYFFHTEKAGIFNLSEKNVFTAKAGSLAIGIVQVQIKINAHNRIIDTRFLAHGCPATIACAAWLADYLQLKSIEEIQHLTSAQIAHQLNLSRNKLHCALLTEDVVQELLKII